MRSLRRAQLRTVAVVIAMVVVSVPPILVGAGQAQSTSDCWRPDTPEIDSYLEAPLWIGEVTFEGLTTSPETYVEDTAAFVQPGDRVRAVFQVVNRVPENCQEAWQTAGRDVDNVVVKWVDPFEDPTGWELVDNPKNGACDGSLNQIGGTCTVAQTIVVPPEDEFDDLGLDEGEHRLRFIAGTPGTEFTAYAGAERVLVVGVTPNLEAESVQLEKDTFHTTYDTGESVEVTIDLKNTGDYAYWNPNGGPDHWGRSAFDGPDVDWDPDDRPAVCKEDYLGRAPWDKDWKGHHTETGETIVPNPPGDGILEEAEPESPSESWTGADNRNPDDDDPYNSDSPEAAPPSGSIWCVESDEINDTSSAHLLNKQDFDFNQDMNDDGSPDRHVSKPDEEGGHRHSPSDATFDLREKRYKALDPALPSCVGTGPENHNGAPWNEAGGNPQDTDASTLICSYKRGSRLPLPVAYELRTDEDTVVETGVLPSDQVQPSPEQMGEDKDDSLIPGGSTVQTISAPLFNTNYKAGQLDAEIALARDETGWIPGPETDRGDNNATGEIKILGVDLRLEDVRFLAKAGGSLCGTPDLEPCPTDATIRLWAKYANVGDPEVDWPLHPPNYVNGTRDNNPVADECSEDLRFQSWGLENGWPSTDENEPTVTIGSCVDDAGNENDQRITVAPHACDRIWDRTFERVLNGSTIEEPHEDADPASTHSAWMTRCNHAGKQPTWSAAVFLDGQRVAFDAFGSDPRETYDAVPTTEEEESARRIWGGDGLHLDPLAEGGVQQLEIRLDHPDNYDDKPPRDVGRVAEKTENNQCQTSQDDLDNVWCVTLHFQDDTVPEIHDIDIDAPRVHKETPAAHEGEDLTFIANVTDNSLEHVNATFDLPNGTTEEMPMDPPDGPGSDWTLTRNFTNVTGNVSYTFTATDAFGHTVEPDEPLNATILELPKAVDVKALQLNGQDLSDHQDDHDHEPPTYQGTASEPENWLRLEANITGTGQDDPASTEAKNVTIHDRTDELRYDVPMGVYTVCDIWNTVTDERERTGAGDECQGSTGDDTTEVRHKRPRFFIDTRCEEGEDPEEHAGDCQSVSQDLREAWQQVEIDWAGTFNVTVSVTDVFNRTKNTTSPATLADVDDEPTLEIFTLGPDELEPGDKLQTSARATDGLRVERVHLEAEQPDGTNATFNLTLDPDKVEDSETKNGTYTTQLTTGAFEDLEQAGVYSVTLVARDLAGKENRSEPAEVTLVDEVAPEIASFTSVPADVQELGGPITWEAEIADATAIKAAVLTLERPASGTSTHPLVYNETADHYELPDPLETSAADLGNWTYTLDVEDWAGNAAEASGYLHVVEDLPPQVTSWTPSVEDDDGDLWGPADPTIQADLVDFGDGVDKSSIEMTVDDEPVSPEISEIDHGYRLSYAPGDEMNLSHGDTVTVQVTAADRSTPDPLVAEDLTHEFSIDARDPVATVSAEPSLLDGTRMIVGPDTGFTVEIQDAGAGPATSPAVLQRLAGNTVEGQDKTDIDPGTPFQLDAFGTTYTGAADYRLEVTPVDAVGNEGNLSSVEITADAAGPSVTVFPKPGEPPEKVFADITDTSRVEGAEIHYTADGTQGDAIPMEEVDGTWQGEIPSFSKNTTVTFRVQAVDFFGNVASSDEKTFKAGDKLPEITFTQPREGAVLSGTATVAWQASDREVEDSDLLVSLYYREDGSKAFTPIPGAQQIANTGSHILETTELPNGQVTLQAIVSDGTSFGDDQVVVQVRNLAKIFQDPRFEDARVQDGKAHLSPGSEPAFSVALSQEARAVWANVTQGGQTLTSHQLQPAEDGQWRGTIVTPEEPGTYEIALTALTADGPTETPGAYTFEVTSDAGGGYGTTAAWILLSVLFAGAVLVGTVGLGRKW